MHPHTLACHTLSNSASSNVGLSSVVCWLEIELSRGASSHLRVKLCSRELRLRMLGSIALWHGPSFLAFWLEIELSQGASSSFGVKSRSHITSSNFGVQAFFRAASLHVDPNVGLARAVAWTVLALWLEIKLSCRASFLESNNTAPKKFKNTDLNLCPIPRTNS